MRVRVLLGDATVRGPARVADPGLRLRALGQRHRARPVLDDAAIRIDRATERAQVPHGPHGSDAVAIEHRDAGAVIAAVLELLEPGEQKWPCLLRTHVPDDSTHPSLLPLSWRGTPAQMVIRRGPAMLAGPVLH